jgi:hypothetical protein
MARSMQVNFPVELFFINGVGDKDKHSVAMCEQQEFGRKSRLTGEAGNRPQV